MKARPEDIDHLNPPLEVFYSAGGHPILAGRTLHYHVLPAGSFSPKREAALVLAVDVEAETCNLRVFPAAGSGGITVSNVKEGVEAGTWSLPPILPRLTSGAVTGPQDAPAPPPSTPPPPAATKAAPPPAKKAPEPPKARKK